MLEPGSDTPLLIEVHGRMLPATHAGALVGIDLSAALRACVDRRSWTGPADLPAGAGGRLALFPQEWLRDPESEWLTRLPSDAPWHDPSLLEAMRKMPFATHALPARDVISQGP